MLFIVFSNAEYCTANLNGNAYNSAVRDNYARQQDQKNNNAKYTPLESWKDIFKLSVLKPGETIARKGLVRLCDFVHGDEGVEQVAVFLDALLCDNLCVLCDDETTLLQQSDIVCDGVSAVVQFLCDSCSIIVFSSAKYGVAKELIFQMQNVGMALSFLSDYLAVL